MADTIRDGKGSGSLAEVDSKNRLRAYTVIEDEATYINRNEGEMYTIIIGSGVVADTAGNFVAYIKNTSSTKDMVIVNIKHRCALGNGTISFWLNVNGTPGGTLTAGTAANRNAGSNNEADAEMYLSTEITGLSGGRQVGSIYGKEDEEFEHAKPCSGFILPPNGTFAVKADDDTAKHYGGLAIYFRDKEA